MRPLILDFAQPLNNNDKDVKSPYLYDEELNLNVIRNCSSRVPFVEINSRKLELITATAKRREASDDDCVQYYLQTETRVKNESIDEISHTLELTTRTNVIRESNDDSIGYELQTQTFVEKDAVDESHCLLLSTITKVKSEQSDDNDFDYNQ